MPVGHPPGGHLGGVVTHQRDHREAQLGPGVGVSPLPHLTGGLGDAHFVQAHAARLNPLAREDVGGRLGLGHRRAPGDDLVTNPAGHLQDKTAADHQTGALHADLNPVAQLDWAEHGVGPAGEHMPSAVGGSRRGGLLGGGRQPHAVHQGGVHAGDPSGVVAGVDRVEVAGDPGEGRHVTGCGHGDATQQPAGGGRRGPAGTAGLLGRGGHRGTGGAAADGEALTHERDQAAIGGVCQLQAHVHYPAGAGLLQRGHPAVDLNDAVRAGVTGQFGQRSAQVDSVIQVDRPQQPLDQGHAVFDDTAQGGVDHRPAGTEQGIGNQRRSGQRGGQRVGGHRGMIRPQGVRQGEAGVNRAEGLVCRTVESVDGAGQRRNHFG